MVRNDDSDIDMDATDVLGMIEDRDESMAKEVLRVVLSYRQRLKDVRAAAPPKIDGVPTVADEKAVAELTDALFTNGSGDEADRLMLVKDHPHRDLGGWCRSAVRVQISALAARIRAEAERETERLRKALSDLLKSATDVEQALFVVHHELPSNPWFDDLAAAWKRLAASTRAVRESDAALKVDA